MKYLLIVFLIAGVGWFFITKSGNNDSPESATNLPELADGSDGQKERGSPVLEGDGPSGPPSTKADSIIGFARTLIGAPYQYACASVEEGFDCSGFTWFVYKEFDIDLPRSSSLQGEAGKPITRKQLKPGDLVVFTGTNTEDRTPGHVGIVTSPEAPVTFIHASSSERHFGVVVSTVEGTGYEKRLLGFRRVIK